MLTVPNPRVKLDYEAYCQLSGETGYELYNGCLVQEPSPVYRHQSILGRLHLALASAASEVDAEIVLSPMDVKMDEYTVLQPDLLMLSAESRWRAVGPYIEGPPDLVVEVLSTTSRERDWHAKRDLYERHGVLEYWIVDIEAQRVTVLCQTDKEKPHTLAERKTFKVSDVLDTPLLPALKLDVGDLFAT